MNYKIINKTISNKGRALTIFILVTLVAFTSCSNPPDEKKKQKKEEPVNEHEEASIYSNSKLNG